MCRLILEKLPNSPLCFLSWENYRHGSAIGLTLNSRALALISLEHEWKCFNLVANTILSGRNNYTRKLLLVAENELSVLSKTISLVGERRRNERPLTLTPLLQRSNATASRI
jgi:hypothetical protein